MNYKKFLLLTFLFFSCSETHEKNSLSNEQFIKAQKIISFLEQSQMNLSKGNYQSSINFVDSAYALMVIPTMVGAILLSPKVIAEARLYFSKL